MGKIFFILIALVIGGLYYVKQNNLFSVDKLSGAKVNKAPEVPLTPEGKPVRMPIFKVGDCINHSKEGWNYYKITGYGDEQYSYKYCEKYKGCNHDLEKAHLSVFEKEYGMDRKLEKCPQ